MFEPEGQENLSLVKAARLYQRGDNQVGGASVALRPEPVNASPIIIGDEETSHGRRLQRRYLHGRGVAVGGTAGGNIETAGDRDWFAVELVAGRTYTIDLGGNPTADGTLSDPLPYGIHHADGNLIANTTNDDGGDGRNSKVTFTATETGTFYIAAGAYRSHQGTYTVEVTDDSAAEEEDDDSAANDDRDDYAANTRTTGVIAVGDTVTGEIETAGDRDWFAVRLISLPGEAFWIRLEGLDKGEGTLPDRYIRSVYEYRPPSASHDGEELFRYPEAYDNGGGTCATVSRNSSRISTRSTSSRSPAWAPRSAPTS